MQLSKREKSYLKRMLNGVYTNDSISIIVHAFDWSSSPQGYGYWSKKWRQLRSQYELIRIQKLRQGLRTIHQELLDEVFNTVLTDEDKGYFRYLLRDKRIQRDSFLKTKKKISLDSFF